MWRLRRLAGFFAPRDLREAFLDDLEEAFEKRRRERGALRAHLWVLRQGLGSLVPFAIMRARGTPPRASRKPRSGMNVESIVRDLRLAVRLLWRAPAFTFAAVLTVALGIGANTAIFSVVHALLLKPLPYPDPDRIVTVWQDMRARGGPEREWATPGNLADWRAEKGLFASAASIRGWGPTLTGGTEPEPLVGEQVTDGYFDVLGVEAAKGRTFRPDEALPNASRVVVISYGLWQRRFGGDAGVIGRRILLGGEPHEVVGVMPEGFRPAILQAADVWRPDRLNLANPSRGAVVLRVVARLPANLAREEADAAATALAARLAEQYPQSNRGVGIAVVPMHEQVVGSVRLGLVVLFGAVLFVLLIACVNIASLQLARAVGRYREIAVRAALGAGRARVVRQLLTESLVLAAAGSVLGVLFSIWAVRGLIAIAPAGMPRLDEVALDGSVLAFAGLMTVVAGLLFGLAPAFQFSRAQIVPALKDGGRGAVGGGAHRLRRSLIVAEVALALVLLIGSGLLLRSFMELRRSDLGFDPANVVTGFVLPPAQKYPSEAHRRAFFDRLLEQAAALPGVVRAAATSVIPLSGGDSDMNFLVEGQPIPAGPDEAPVTWYRLVSAGYFEAMGIPLRAGRPFEPGEPSPVVIVNQALADKYWPGQDAVGRRVKFGSLTAPWHTVVAVAGDVKQQGARAETRLQTFIPYWQLPELGGGLNIVLKTAASPEALIQPLRFAVREIDSDIPLTRAAPMRDLVAQSIEEPRFLASIVGLFAAVALIVAAVGVYGLMSYHVTERRTEIGVRLALGASRRSVFGLVLKDGLTLAALGVALGTLASFALAPLLGALLFGIAATDPWTFAATAAGILAVAALASLIPARRATRVEPVEALR